MPDLVGGNINAPVIMIAENAADPIRGCALLAPVNVEALTPKHGILKHHFKNGRYSRDHETAGEGRLSATVAFRAVGIARP